MKNYRQQVLVILLLFVSALINWSCTEKDLDPTDPKQSYLRAREPFDNENYEIGIQKLREFKARFPYSQYTVEAELLIADSHFALGQYLEAAAAYEQFAKLHPSHEKLDYALFRVGKSYWEEAPEEMDREQEYTYSAITAFRNVVEKVPKSQYVKESQEMMLKGRRRIADSYQFIARFYCKLEVYHACAFRYVKLANEFAEFKEMAFEGATKGADALDKLASQKEKDPQSDKNIYFRDLTPEKLRQLAVALREKSSQYK